MIKTTILSGTEQKVEFSGNHTHYWVQNLSDSDVLASLSSGITEGADNVLTIPAGGVSYVRDDKGASSVYLLGTGKVQIYGKSNEFCPFKAASGGGDSGGSGSGETNKIESISVNGQTIAPDANKNVNIEIPEMPEDIDADTVNGHTVESNVPANAVFTDTIYTLPAASESALGGVLSGGDISVDENGSVTVNSVNGKTVGADVPEDAVFTDTTYSLSNSGTTIKLTDSENKISQINAACCNSITVAPGETVTLYSTSYHASAAALKLLVAFNPSNAICQCAWYSMGVKPIEGFENTAFTETASQSGRTLTFTNPSATLTYTVKVFGFM